MSKYGKDNVADWGTGQSTNADSSAGYVALSSSTQPVTFVTVVNSSGVDIEVRSVEKAGSPLVLASGSSQTFLVKELASEIEWKREDSAASSASVSFYWGL